jgi:glycosyltransferase involved in cell wall biosynthesis
MKLLMISGDRSILAGKRGAFWYTLEEMRKHWERIDVICPKARGAAILQPFENVFFHPSPSSLPFQSRWIVKKGAELHAAHHHEVMTVHEYPPFYNGLGALKLSKQTGIPAVAEIHHLVGYPVPASLTERIGAWLSRRFLPRELPTFAAVRVVNAEVKRTLVEWGVPGDKIAVVPSFYLDGAILGPRPDAEKTYDVVFAARLMPNKGLLPVIEAVALLPGKRLLIIGDGPELSAAKRLAERRGIADRVTFAGWLSSQQDLADAMRSARTFVMNSLSEGGPRVLLEALACGIPVISTRVGIAPDVIRDGENGVFTDGTFADVSRAIELVLGMPSMMETAQNDTLHILRLFERSAAIRAYAEFLQEVARH